MEASEVMEAKVGRLEKMAMWSSEGRERRFG